LDRELLQLNRAVFVNVRAGRRIRGFSIFEMLAVLALSSALSGIVFMNIRELDRPAMSGAAQLRSFVQQVRGRAISQTSAYKVSAYNSYEIRTEVAERCNSTTWVTDPAVRLRMPVGAQLSSTTWSFCINSRGLADANVTVPIVSDNQSVVVEVMLGGATRFIS
jgi:hypothetical protein